MDKQIERLFLCSLWIWTWWQDPASASTVRRLIACADRPQPAGSSALAHLCCAVMAFSHVDDGHDVVMARQCTRADEVRSCPAGTVLHEQATFRFAAECAGKMLNVPTHDEDMDSRASAGEHQQRYRRRRLRSGERVAGWADVRKIRDASRGGVDKFHVDLNMTAQLSWTEWQLMCDAEGDQTEAPTWLVVDDNDNDSAKDSDEQDVGMNDDQGNDSSALREHRGRNEGVAAASTPQYGARFVRRHSQSPARPESASQ